jgi:hypothetical protein
MKKTNEIFFMKYAAMVMVLKIDNDFWRMIKAVGISNFLHRDEGPQVIELKGWKIGRKGTVMGTHTKNRRKFVL